MDIRLYFTFFLVTVAATGFAAAVLVTRKSGTVVRALQAPPLRGGWLEVWESGVLKYRVPTYLGPFGPKPQGLRLYNGRWIPA